MYRITVIFVLILICTSALSASESILKRQEAMQVVRNTMKILGPIAKGSTEYDQLLVEANLENMLGAMKPYNLYFPVGSEIGNKTQASPNIWEMKEDFEKLVDNFIIDIESAINSDLDNTNLFSKNFEIISKNCRSCHKVYRSR